MKHDLLPLIHSVKAFLTTVPDFDPDSLGLYEHRDAVRRRQEAAARALDTLAQRHSARVTRDYRGTGIRLAGVSSSSTAGDESAMKNWIQAAYRRLDKEASC